MNRYQQSGFSLVETLVAITILLIVIVGPLTIISSTARSTSFASDQVVAFFLAQEGAELAQKARDDILLTSFPPNPTDTEPWDTFTDTSGGGDYRDCFISVNSNGCGLEISDEVDGALKTPVRCTGVACKLWLPSSTSERSWYTHSSSGNADTGFSRSVKFEIVSPYEVKVVSEVTWFSGVIRSTQSVKVETYLYDVYGN